MKKTLTTAGRVAAFVALWELCEMIVEWLGEHQSLIVDEAWRRLAEMTVLLILTFALNQLFYRSLDRDMPRDNWRRRAGRGLRFGLLWGTIWLALTMGVMWAAGIISFGPLQQAGDLAVWLGALLIDLVMEEALLHGYLFELIEHRHGPWPAIIVSTLLFVALHYVQFGYGMLYVANLLAMGIFSGLLHCLYASLWAPTMAHYLWDAVGELMGCLALTGGYPHILTAHFTGAAWLAGGPGLLEGSGYVLAIDMLLAGAAWYLWHRRSTPVGGHH